MIFHLAPSVLVFGFVVCVGEWRFLNLRHYCIKNASHCLFRDLVPSTAMALGVCLIHFTSIFHCLGLISLHAVMHWSFFQLNSSDMQYGNRLMLTVLCYSYYYLYCCYCGPIEAVSRNWSQ